MLTGVSELLLAGGGTLAKEEGESPRSRGIRMGIFMLLLLIVIAPIIGMISVFLFRAAPWPMGVAIFLIGGGGILRIAYALMFESGIKKSSLRDENDRDASDTPRTIEESLGAGALPPQREVPASGYAPPDTGHWLDTNDLEPASVIENTTKFLEKNK